jgi:hypothetical protein
MSVGIDSEGVDLFPSSDQLIYRIYTDHSLGLLPDENEYVNYYFCSCLISPILLSLAAVSSGSIPLYQLALVTSLQLAPGTQACVGHNLTLSSSRTTSRVLADSSVTLPQPMRLALVTGGPSRLR